MMWQTFLQIFKQNKFFVLPTLMFVTIGVVFSICFSKTDLVLWANSHNHIVLDTFFYYLTFIGDGLTFLCVVILYFVFYKHKKKWAWIGLFIFTLPALITQILKRLFFKTCLRPSMHIAKENLHIVNNLELSELHSFPSGHAVISFSMAMFFSFQIENNFLKFLLFLATLLIAYSRMYLAQHFLIDISIGALIGTIFALIVYSFSMPKKTNEIS